MAWKERKAPPSASTASAATIPAGPMIAAPEARHNSRVHARPNVMGAS
jgi:hypothetical protein